MMAGNKSMWLGVQRKGKRGNAVPVVNTGKSAEKGRGRNRKSAKKLDSRRADYSRMMSDNSGKASKQPMGTFHQPGSNQ
jgi:hypothetical protein